MGGTGSGTWHRTGVKDTTASRLRLDVRELKPTVQSDARTTGYINRGWNRLSFELKEDSLVLGAFSALDDIDLAHKPYEIMFERTACHFGGTRHWFRCPICEGRVGTLYLEDGNFACRVCCNLGYQSQLESRASRLITKAHKIRHKLGASGSRVATVTDKPKGMHRQTYFRTLHELQETINAANKAVMAELYPHNPEPGTLCPSLERIIAESESPTAEESATKYTD